MLDTSAVIGWIELQSPSVIAALDGALRGDEVPFVHLVTIGELEHGVASSNQSGDEQATAARAATLQFARDELGVIELTADPDQLTIYGTLSALTTRRVSHNDRWIASAALLAGHTLATQDQRLADELGNVIAAAALQPWRRSQSAQSSVVYCPR